MRGCAGSVLGVLLLGLTAGPSLEAQRARDTLMLRPIVVTATRVPTPRTSVAATVTVLHAEELRAQGVHRVLDALRSVPGLSVVQSGSYGSNTSVLLRGGESDYVKVLIDGVPVNDPGGAFDFANLTLDNVDRIELVRGPVSVLYGSDATTGVVEIFTRRGRGRPAAEVGVRGGTFRSVMLDGGISGGTDDVAVSFGLSRSTTDGTYAFNNDYDHLEVSGLVRAQPDEWTDATLMLRYSDSDFRFPTDGSGQVVDANARQLRDRLVASLSASRFLAGWLESRVQLAFNETDGGLDDASDGPADTLGFFGFHSSQTLERRSIDVRTNIYLEGGTVFTAGANLESQRERSSSESQSQFGNSTGSVDVERNGRGYYVQLQAEPFGQLAVNGGVRFDDNDAFGEFVTYRTGATYQFASRTRIRASLGKAFKEPTFFETFSDTPFAIGNPELDPERSMSWEVGIEQEFLAGRGRIAATYFDQRFRELIQFTASPPAAGGPNFFNVAAADASGLELEAEAVLDAVRLGGNYTWLHTEVTDAGYSTGAGAAFVAGERLLRRPSHSVSMSANARVADRTRVGLDLHRIGERDDRDFTSYPATPVVLPAYTRVDVSAGYTLRAGGSGRSGLAVSARIENLFDAGYQEVFGFPARKRTVSLGGKLDF